MRAVLSKCLIVACFVGGVGCSQEYAAQAVVAGASVASPHAHRAAPTILQHVWRRSYLLAVAISVAIIGALALAVWIAAALLRHYRVRPPSRTA